MFIPYCKSLSKAEKEYLTLIMDGMDNRLIRAGEWFASPEAKRYFREHRDDISNFFNESGIREELETLLEENIKDSASYIERFYETGAKLGYSDLNAKLIFTVADQEALYFLKNYNFNLISNLNTELEAGIRNIITESVLEGKGYKETARLLLELPLTPINANITLRQRAEMIARTEHARAINTGTMQAYSNMGVTEVNILTVGDSAVCDDCLDLEANNPYSLEEAMNFLPVHPNCRCSYTPVIDSINHDVDPVIVNLTVD